MKKKSFFFNMIIVSNNIGFIMENIKAWSNFENGQQFSYVKSTLLDWFKTGGKVIFQPY